MKYDVRNKLELITNLDGWLQSSKSFKITHNKKSIHVKLSTDNYVELEPNPTNYRWDYKFYSDYKAEIVDAITKTIFVNPNLYNVFKTLGGSNDKDKIWYFDKRNCKAFYIDEDGKVHRDVANEFMYSEAIDAGKDHFHIDRSIVDDSYVLTEHDLAVIENTDIDPDEFRKAFIERWKGKHWHREMARLIKQSYSHYKYKSFYNCKICGKQDFYWFEHKWGVMIDYRPDYVCKECQPAYDKQKAEEKAKREAEHKARMKSDPEYRKQQEELERCSPKLYRVKMPTIKASEIIEERPMEPPRDTIYFMSPTFGRTGGK